MDSGGLSAAAGLIGTDIAARVFNAGDAAARGTDIAARVYIGADIAARV